MLHTRPVPSKPALILEGKKRYLVITDTHIGFEGGMASNEIFVGKNSTTNETVSEIEGIINSEDPDSIVLLGDIKSGIRSISRSEWEEVPIFFERLASRCDVILIPGNHDANIQRLVPDSITMISPAGMVEENVLLTHGHTMPSANFSHVDRIIMGHVHPVFFQEDSVMNGQRVWVSLKTEKGNVFPDKSGELEITIIPSFNRYFYATHKRRHARSISPIIDRVRTVSRARIVTLDGSIIGDESVIGQVI